MELHDLCTELAAFGGDGPIISALPGSARFTAYSESPCLLSSEVLPGPAAAIGLGLALARPDTEVLVIDSAATFLRDISCLPMIAQQPPGNLLHCVVRTPDDTPFELTAAALASGYARAFKAETLEQLTGQLPEILAETGPVLAEALVPSLDAGIALPGQWPQPDCCFRDLKSGASRVQGALSLPQALLRTGRLRTPPRRTELADPSSRHRNRRA